MTLFDTVNKIQLDLEKLLEGLTIVDVDQLEIVTKGKLADYQNAVAVEYTGWEVIDESANQDEYQFNFRISISVRDEDPDTQRVTTLKIHTKIVELLYADRTLTDTVIDVKVLSGDFNGTPESIREEEDSFGSQFSTIDCTVNALVDSPT